ncbi:MAG: exodeoxyribonuclease V subunit alpha [Opitutales bacterium]
MSLLDANTEDRPSESAPLARQLAACFERWSLVPEPLLAHVLERLCECIQTGDTCLLLDSTTTEMQGISPREAVERLEATGLAGPPEVDRPLVLDSESRLYLRQEWRLGNRLAHALVARLAQNPQKPDDEPQATVNGAGSENPEFRRMSMLAGSAPLSLISGGPGTGKTTGLIRFLRAQLARCPETLERLALCAPTGKAAARLREGLSRSDDFSEAVRHALVERVGTVHRLLRPFGPARRFRHHSENLLPVDLLVVDEASMLDNHLLTHLLEATPSAARIVLLGDPDQLASVETGAAFGELVRAAADIESDALRSRYLDTKKVDTLKRGLANRSVRLTRNYRFACQPGIAGLCEAIRQGDADQALGILRDSSLEDAQLRSLTTPNPLADEAFRAAVLRSVQPLLEAGNVNEALARLPDSQVLCVLRRGSYGVGGVQRQLMRLLGHALSASALPNGMPVTLLRNSSRLGRANGDVGVAWTDGSQTAVWFAEGDGAPVGLSLSSLPEWTPGPALTVHRSQGSEYGRVHVLLPPDDHPLLTRELIYTAVSRARTAVTLWGSEPALRCAIERPTRRQSGLLAQMQALWDTRETTPLA